VAGETYLLPIETVVECVELPAEERGHKRDRGVINLRGHPLPYLRLREHFSLTGPEGERESVVVVRDGEGFAGLAVDSLYGEGQTVIKPLSGLFRDVPGVSGSALLGNGRVALILEVADLLKQVLHQTGDSTPDTASA
jgi:two-component system chemotaxis sensor kinase CheA